jgi:hypothetical protein
LYLYFQEQKIKDSVVPLFEIPYSKKELQNFMAGEWNKFSLDELKIIADQYKINYRRLSNKSELIQRLHDYFQSTKIKGIMSTLMDSIF